ncbi:hypothetical protein [Micrococcus luteus]|uniref:hypothetical protein n=1 Tax=Micrococcus luteus TaxID=1270 RepID=UPI003980DE89
MDVKARTVTVRGTGASLSIETSDGASAYGTRPWLTVVEELSMCPSTQNYRQLWGAIVSAVPKVPGPRLVVIGTAGPPAGLGAEVRESVQAAPSWRTARTPGPSLWWFEAYVESTGADLMASHWRRLILCEWAEGDDSLTTPNDVEAAIRGGSTVLEPRPGVQYVAALDVGTRRDLTALAVRHRERRAEGPVVVVDRVLYWRPPTGGRVDLAQVEAVVLRVCRQYRARLRFDRMQAEQMTANLERAGVTVREYVFSAQGANRLARGIHGALRDRALSLPDDAEVRDEFLSTRLVETAPGVVKLSNPRGAHDDIVTAVGMVVADLTERPDPGGGGVTVPRGVIPPRALGGGLRESARLRGAGLPGMPAGRPGSYGVADARIPGRGAPGTHSGARWGR